jgi:hypothetical protein
MQVGAANQSVAAYLLARRNGGGYGGWMLRAETSGLGTTRLLGGDNNATVQRVSTASVTPGVLTSVVGVFTTNTATFAGNAADIYVNGALSNGASSTANNAPYYPCGVAPCTLTAGNESALGAGTWFVGTYMLIELYPVGLLPEEIVTLGKGRLQRPGLSRARTAWWPLDECPDGTQGGGFTVRDVSGNGRHGSVSAGANGTGQWCYASTLSIPWGPH